MKKQISNSEKIIQDLLNIADIKINGNQPWDIRVHNNQFYDEVLKHGSLGLGEAYMNEWWECDQIDELFTRILKSNLQKFVKRNTSLLLNLFKFRLFNPQNRNKSRKSIVRHYDLGDDLYRCMLDKNMMYSCGYWKDTNDLDEAQEAKNKIICEKLFLKEGMDVLDIGCGWGGFAIYAAKHYGVKVIGVTLSENQIKESIKRAHGLNVEFRLQDYRDITGSFDRIVSIGMFEHVGERNHRTFMKKTHNLLKNGGLQMLHTIGGNFSNHSIDPWINMYIFPNANIPSASQIANSIDNLFVIEDWHNFGTDYDKTLLAWHKNFTMNWDELKEKYDERFYRMWTYYLLLSAGTFRSRYNQLWQIVLSKGVFEGGYKRIV